MPSGVYKHNPCSEETKLKISQSRKGKNYFSLGNKGKKHPGMHHEKQFKKGQVSWNKGKELSIGHKINLSTAQKTRFKNSKHPLWKEDRKQLVKSEKKHLDSRYREWMLAVKNRDKWICRIADNNCDGRLEAHHILNWKNYPELRYELNNGITLCHAHHPRKRSEEAKLSPYFQKLVAEIK